THTTLNPSCSQGLPKPGGRFCIFYSSSPLLCRAKSRHLLLWAGEARKRNKSRDSPTSLGMTTMKQRRVSQLIRVRKPMQGGIIPPRPEVVQHPAEDRIQQRIRVNAVQVVRHQLAIQMKLRLIVQRIAVVILQSLFQRP